MIESGKDKVFVSLISQFFETYGDKGPPPQLHLSSRRPPYQKINWPEKQTLNRALPQSLAIQAAFEKVKEEIAGKNPGSLPLPTGKFPAVPTSVRNKQYKTHSSRITSGFPILDEDAVKVDNQASSFKTVPIDRPALRALGHSINASLRAASYADWLLAFAWRKLPKDDLPTVVSNTLRALALSVAHISEFSARTHATLLLLE